MEKITNRKELIEMLKNLRAVEIEARNSYEDDIVTFSNFEIVDTIKKIKTDEDKHIALLEDCINTLEKGSKS